MNLCVRNSVAIPEGKGKKRRHIKIRQIKDIQEKKVKDFVTSAMNEHEVK
jgi:ribosomal protein L20A (L18A)